MSEATQPNPPVMAPEVTSVVTLQFHVGGLFDGRTLERAIHLVRGTQRGTPGPTLCGIARFAPETPGWSVGGGFSGDYEACEGCEETRRSMFRNLPVRGMHAALFAEREYGRSAER